VHHNANSLSVLATVRNSYSFVTGNLPLLMNLGKGPAIAALLLGGLFGFHSGFQVTPIFAIAVVVAYGWFSFYVFRMVLLGPDKARVPAPPPTTGEAASTVRSPLPGFMGRTLTLAAGAMGVFFLLTVVITVPLTLLDHVADKQPVAMRQPAYQVIDMLVISGILFCLPVGVPLARFSGVLPASAIGEDTGFGLAWRQSRGFGLRLAVIWVVLAAPFFLGYALLNAALTQFFQLVEGAPALAPSLLVLVLITAIGMTATALLTHATARAWMVMTDGDTAKGRQ
jgi:hypothetical protein